MEQEILLKIEQAALNAWPAPRQMIYDGWLLRFAGGSSKRVNSVNPLYPSSLPVEEKIPVCADIYAREEQMCLFRVSEMFANEDLKRRLQDAGYTGFDPTSVLGRSLEMGGSPHPDVTILEMPMDDWFRMRDHFINVSDVDRQVHQAIISGIVPEKVLMGLFVGSRPVACGMGVVEGDLMGFFSIYTASKWRRKGYAEMIMAALTDWGVEHGAVYGYLQVEEYNKPALALYKKLGYQRCYSYVYYERVNSDR